MFPGEWTLIHTHLLEMPGKPVKISGTFLSFTEPQDKLVSAQLVEKTAICPQGSFMWETSKWACAFLSVQINLGLKGNQQGTGPCVGLPDYMHKEIFRRPLSFTFLSSSAAAAARHKPGVFATTTTVRKTMELVLKNEMYLKGQLHPGLWLEWKSRLQRRFQGT